MDAMEMAREAIEQLMHANVQVRIELDFTEEQQALIDSVPEPGRSHVMQAAHRAAVRAAAAQLFGRSSRT